MKHLDAISHERDPSKSLRMAALSRLLPRLQRLTSQLQPRISHKSFSKTKQPCSQDILKILRARMSTHSIPKTMKGVVIEKTGGVEVLDYRTDLPVPEPKEGQVLVKNELCGINYIDTYVKHCCCYVIHCLDFSLSC